MSLSIRGFLSVTVVIPAYPTEDVANQWEAGRIYKQSRWAPDSPQLP